jgi:hypothetical protein
VVQAADTVAIMIAMLAEAIEAIVHEASVDSEIVDLEANSSCVPYKGTNPLFKSSN